MFRKISLLQLAGIKLLDYDKCKRKTRTSKCCLFVCFHVWLIFAFILNMTAIGEMLNRSDFTIALSVAFANLACLALFTTLWIKRHEILKLKKIVEKISNNNASKTANFLKIFQVLNLFLFIFYPIIFINQSFPYFKNILTGLLFIVFMYAFIFYNVTLPLSVTLMYANFCYWCSTQLKFIASQLKSTAVFLNEKRVFGILQYYQFILDVTLSVENAFSTATFFSMVSYLIIIFAYMGNLIRRYQSENYIIRCQMLFNLILEVCSMTAHIAYASEIPTVIERIKLNLCIMEEKLSLTRSKKVSNDTKSIIKIFSKRDVFAFSACNVVHFKRSLIITTYGALLTYGLLLLQLT